MRELTAAEIKDVSGGVANFVFGGVAGAAGYGAVNLMTGQSMTWSGAAGATVAGALTSGYSAIGGATVAGAGGIARSIVAVARGTVGGAAASGAARDEDS